MYRPLVKISRQLRKEQTIYERKLWRVLKAGRFASFKFRRQHVIGPYVADFCCPESKVIIELDGAGHLESHQKTLDRNRDSYLKERGYRVLRIWNNDLIRNWNGVLEELLRVLGSPSPPPSPQRGREIKRKESCGTY